MRGALQLSPAPLLHPLACRMWSGGQELCFCPGSRDRSWQLCTDSVSCRN